MFIKDKITELDSNGINRWIESKFKYEWFEPISWERFVKSIKGDFSIEDKEQKPEGDWKVFWKFYWTWNKYYGIRKSIPDLPKWAQPLSQKPDKAYVQSNMKIWRSVIMKMYTLYKTSKILTDIHTAQLEIYKSTLQYWGWTYPPKEPINMKEISKPLVEQYFDVNFSQKSGLSFAKKPKTKFCTKPLALDVSGDEVRKFYFVANSVASRAYCKAINKKTKEEVLFNSEEDLEKAIKEGSHSSPKYFLEGVSSTTLKDADSEKMSEKAIHSMHTSSMSKKIPLRNAHSREWDSDLGYLSDSAVEYHDGMPVFRNTFEMNDFDKDPLAKKLWHAVNDEKEIGLSIGGMVLDYYTEFDSEIEKDILVYDDIDLMEVSATSMPSNPGTFISALTKAKKTIEKDLGLASDEDKPSDSPTDKVKDDRDLSKLEVLRGIPKYDDPERVPVIKALFSDALKSDYEDECCYDPYCEMSYIDVSKIVWLIQFLNSIESIDLSKVEAPDWMEDWSIPYPEFPDEAYIYASGMTLYPHHKADFSLDENLVLYYLKDAVTNPYFNLDELISILKHLEHHLLELKLIDPEVGKSAKDVTILLGNLFNLKTKSMKTDKKDEEVKDDQKTTEEVVEEETTVEDEVVEDDDKSTDDDAGEDEKKEDEEKEEDGDDDDDDDDDEEDEDEEKEKSHLADIAGIIAKALEPITKELAELKDKVDSEPQYKEASAIVKTDGEEDEEDEESKDADGEELNKRISANVFEKGKSYDYDSARKTLDEKCGKTDTRLYNHRQILRTIYSKH